MDSQTVTNDQLLIAQLTWVRDAIATLRNLGLPTRGIETALEERLSEITRKASEADMRWPLDVAVSIDEHVSLGDDRPTLSNRLVVGRAYALTPGQRDVIREWFAMTPAPLVEVLEVALYDGTKYIRRVTLRSCEHIDPRRRRVINKLTIDEWGKFCDLAKQRDAERDEVRAGNSEDVLRDDSAKVPAKGKSTKSFDKLLEEYAV